MSDGARQAADRFGTEQGRPPTDQGGERHNAVVLDRFRPKAVVLDRLRPQAVVCAVRHWTEAQWRLVFAPHQEAPSGAPGRNLDATWTQPGRSWRSKR